MPDDVKDDNTDSTDLVNEPAENTAEPDETELSENVELSEGEKIEDEIKTESASLVEEVEEFFHTNPLVQALHNILSGAKTKNPDGSYTITVPDEHVGAAHEALADATKT